MALAILVASFALLWVSSGYAITSATSLAKRLGVSPFIVGVVILGFGTSLPELATVVSSALSPYPQMALANAVGSNIANVLLILPVAGLFCPLALPAIPKRDLAFSLLVPISVAVAIYLSGGIAVWWGGAFVALMLFYAASGWLKNPEVPSQGTSSSPSLWVDVAKITASLVCILLGAKLAVASGIEIAQAFGIAEESIALVGFAIGTSLPELALVVAAASKKQGEFILGNIVGSNIFNLWGILGIAGLVHPLRGFSPEFVAIDLPLLIASACWFLLCLKPRRQHRLEALLLLGVYCLWCGLRIG